MGEELIEFPVIYGSEIITLFLSKENAARASNDQQFLEEIINEQCNYKLKCTSTPTESPEEKITDESNQKSFIWSDAAVFLLIELYREREQEFTSGNKRHNMIWKEIAAQMKETNGHIIVTGIQCSMKFAGLKRTYKNIRDQNKKSGNSHSSWAFFSVMDSLIGEKAYIKPPAEASSDGPPPISITEPSTSKLSLDNVQSTSRKRRLENILENYVEDIRCERETAKKEREEEKKTKEEERRSRYKERKEERARIHQQNLEVQKSILAALHTIINKN